MTGRAAKGGRVRLDPKRLEKAQAVIASLAEEYPARLLAGARRIAALWRESGNAAGSLRELRRLAHDIAGQGTTFGYPLASAVAGALSKLFAGEVLAHPEARAAIDAHVAALVAIASGPISGDGGEAGATLADGLRRTREKLGLDA